MNFLKKGGIYLVKLRSDANLKKISITVSLAVFMLIAAFSYHVYVFSEFYNVTFVANNIHLNWGPLILLFLFCSDLTILIIKFLSLYFTLPFIIPMNLVWMVVADWCVLILTKSFIEGVAKALKEVSE